MNENCQIPIIPQSAEPCSVLQDERTTAHHQSESLDHIHTQADLPVELRLSPPLKLSQPHCRSVEAKTRRNKKRHEKMHLKRKQYVVKRRFEADWTIAQMKAVLKQLSIRRGQIWTKAKHVLHIHFNNDTERQQAESNLPSNSFDEKHYQQWIAEHL